MSRVLGFCLTLGTAEAWGGFTFLATLRLSPEERAALAYSALRSLDDHQAELTAEAAVGAGGAPLPSCLGGMTQARMWASHANPAELKAYALAAYEAMSHRDQTAFLRHISEVEIPV